jgi:ABC-type enterochelin transport system permease subunit
MGTRFLRLERHLTQMGGERLSGVSLRSGVDLSRDRLKHDQTLSGSAVIYAAATAILGQVNFAGLAYAAMCYRPTARRA